MTFVPITLPPGVAKPGTKYDARGRWYDTNLVRWHQGVMQPIPGWQIEGLTGTVLLPEAAIQDAGGGSFFDYTTAARDADAGPTGIGDVVMFDTASANDAFYVGGLSTFDGVTINLITSGSGGAGDWAIVYEYWNGAAWTALAGVTDSTTELTTLGVNTVVWTVPGAWATTTVNSMGPYYWMRFRVSSTTVAQNVYAAQIWLGRLVTLGGACRGSHSWRVNDGASRVAFGTASKLYALGEGVLENITPVGFTTGAADASLASGAFGAGAFGVGPFGVGAQSVSVLTEANTWQMDNYGEDLVAVAYSDGDLYYWDSSAGGAAVAISGSPANCLGVVVTPERFVLALAAEGDARKIMWPDQDSITTWTATDVNQAGDINLPGKGAILGGRRAYNETLVWTDTDVFAVRYIGGEFIYTAVPVGDDGAISRRAFAVCGHSAYWMGSRGFYEYNGFATPLHSDLSDYVFSDINVLQVSKIWVEVRGQYAEVTWHYPSAGSLECDRSVTYNRQGKFWYPNASDRTAGEDRGAWPYPIATDAIGIVYQHETGDSYVLDGEEQTPRAESGPYEIGVGDRTMDINGIIPDEKTLGDLEMSLFTSYYPNTIEAENGPYSPAVVQDVRLNARWVRLKISQLMPGWRLGTVRLDIEPGSLL